MNLPLTSNISRGRKSNFIFLITLLFLTLVMILLGGVTRLTESGLSIVDWEIIDGILPPLSQKDFNEKFNQYKKFPEYKILNQKMDLSTFKKIFYYEYFHRLLGRLIGLITISMLIFLAFFKKFSPVKGMHYFFLLVLVSAQGLFGWYMVQSGLIDIPHVSHYRLTIHLLLALIFFSYLLVILLNYLKPIEFNVKTSSLNKVLNLALILFILQIMVGALLAGLDGALTSNTYPLMHGSWIPPNLFSIPGNLIDKTLNNPLFLNFLHRHLGVVLAFFLFLISIYLMAKPYPFKIKKVAIVLLLLACLQPILGILTLIMNLPVIIASFHQGFGVLILTCLIYLKFFLHRNQSD